jgi:hypothetical protein
MDSGRFQWQSFASYLREFLSKLGFQECAPNHRVQPTRFAPCFARRLRALAALGAADAER